MTELRSYQAQALQAIRESLMGGVRRLVVQAPTGSGKTLVAANIGQLAQRKGNRLVFVVPAISLIDQTIEMFYAEGIRDIGVIQADHPLTDWGKPIQIASIQTIRSRKTYPQAAVVIFDEVHQLHKEHIAWAGRLDEHGKAICLPVWQNVPFIGLSATPWTKGLGRYFESLLVMSTTRELIDQGYLSKFKVMAADHPNLDDVKIVAGDYHEKQLSAVMQGRGLVANIVETWRQQWNRDKTFLFCVDCAHAQALQQRFHDSGISCAYQDANTSLVERAAIKKGFHNGQYRVIANVGTLTTGVDYDVRCISFARPTKSEILFVQIIGRGLRTAEGKEHCLILDHTDTTSRLGFVSDIHHEELDDGRMRNKSVSKRTPPLPKPCHACQYLIPVGVKVCPNCGAERKIESKIVEHAGELVEFTGYYRRAEKSNPHFFPYSSEEKTRFFAQLKGYGMKKEYKPGWASMKYLEKFGEWPPWHIKPVAAMEPGPEVLAFIKASIKQWVREKYGNQRRV